MEERVLRPQMVDIRALPRRRRRLPAAPQIRRDRVVQRLEEAAASGFVLLTAPAGWGKSSALADWAHATDRSIAWVGCISRHNDPARFFDALITSLGHAGAQISDDLVAMLRSPRPMPEAAIVGLLSEGLGPHTGRVALILDDFHLIDEPLIRQVIYGLATERPEGLTVVVSGRERPGWPLARLRAHGQVVELGPRDLAFDASEIAALLDDGVDASFVASMAERSEGWAAGLHLARLWMRQGGDASSVLSAFDGTHRDIADYLAEEVIERLPEELERFLLVTSVPDAFTASMAGEIDGVSEPERLLRDVEQRGLFLLPLDHERRWYRYHAVFRQFLRNRLRARDGHGEAGILAAVSRWHEREGDLVDAADYALRAGEQQRAVDVLEHIAEDLVLHRGEAHTLVRLMDRLAPDAYLDRPSLLQFHAWALVLLGRLGEATALADRLASAGTGMQEEVAGIRARIAAYRGEQDEAIRQATIALADTECEKRWFRADTLLSRGFAYRVVGRIDEALDAFTEAAAAGWDCGFAHGALWGARYQALTLISQGRLRDAAHEVDRAFERAAASGLDRGAPLAALLISRGEIRYERNDPAGAREDLERGLALAQEAGDAKILMNAYVAMSQLEQADGHDDVARRFAGRATMVFDGPGEKAHAAWIALRQGDIPAVRRWLEAYTGEVGEEPDLCIGEGEQMMVGRALLALGETGRAREFLGRLLAQANESGRLGRAMTIHLLLGQVALAEADSAGADDHLAAAIEVAASEGFCRAILDEGPDVLAAVRAWAQEHGTRVQRQYVARLLSPMADAVNGTPQGNGRLAEPLTPRQAEVLHLMAEGLSNREIAGRLFVSEGTIKAHVHQIYAKLLVRTRAEALVAARDLALVEDPA